MFVLHLCFGFRDCAEHFRSCSIKTQGLSGTENEIQGLEIGLLKFKGFQGFPRRVRTLAKASGIVTRHRGKIGQ